MSAPSSHFPTHTSARRHNTRRTARIVAVTSIALAVAAPTLIRVASAATPPPKLLVSKHADRRAPVALNASWQLGKIYVFANTVAGTKRAEFWLDRDYKTTTPTKIEDNGPYDLQGGTLTAATALDTLKLRTGSHYVTLRLSSLTGATTVETATFKVVRTAPAPTPVVTTSPAASVTPPVVEPKPTVTTTTTPPSPVVTVTTTTPPVVVPEPTVTTTTTVAPPVTPPVMTGWPSASNTGIPSGTTMVDLGGMLDVTDTSVSVAGVTHSFPSSGVTQVGPGGAVAIAPGKVTVTNAKMTRLRNRSSKILLTGSRVSIRLPVGTSGANFAVDATQSSGTSRIVLSECVVYGATADIAVAWRNFSLDRCDVSGGLDAVRLGSNTTVTNSYLHDLQRATGSHNDIFQIIGGSNVLVRHNTLLAYRASTDDPMNAVLQIGDMTNSTSNLTFDDNYVDGGNFTFNANWNHVDQGLETVTGVRITNNVFGRNYRYGPKASMSHGIVWSGNTWADTGGAV